MTDRRRFAMGAPAFGPAHLSPDAVVAFVDDELAHGPHTRALAHVAECPDCAAEVVAQRRTRSALRAAAGPSLPSSLLSSLRAIPQDTDLPGPPAGLAITHDGQLVSLMRAERPPSGPAGHDTDRPAARRRRFGAGAAVSGLALGAIAFGATALPADAPFPTSVPERGGVLGGGPVVGPARLAIDSGVRPAPIDPDVRLADRAFRAPRTFLRHGPR